MPTKSNGSRKIDEAIAVLIQNQAALLAEQTRFISEQRETNRNLEETRKSFARIEAIVLRHERMLTELPEVIRQKIGFKAK
ncbi:MAG: hypothetical protein HYU27_10095 [Acidobacteria bacterium]|nr:hypothetical protein [Acidobacteriota bacterium]